MAKKSPAGTNVDRVRQQNQASAQGNSQDAQFSATDVQQVRQQNQASQQGQSQQLQ